MPNLFKLNLTLHTTQNIEIKLGFVSKVLCFYNLKGISNFSILSTMKKLCYSFTLLIFLSCGKSSPKTDMKSANQVNKFEDSIRAIKSLMKPEMNESSSENTGLLVKQKRKCWENIKLSSPTRRTTKKNMGLTTLAI
jgi:hypothetical protein